jgi:site-specific recombinase XerD
LQFYIERLSKVFAARNCTAITRQQVLEILNSIPANKYGLATRHATYRAMKTFYRWLNKEHGLPNPVDGLPAPILGKPILPTLSLAQVNKLLDRASDTRTRAIVALFVESGLRLSEVASIKADDIDWQLRTVRVIGKGRKEADAPFGPLTARYLKAWLSKRNGACADSGNIWGINAHGIVSILRRLGEFTGIHCNPHVFRRTFAVLLRQAGVDSLTIKNLGRWESVAMVDRYTRAFTFLDSLRHYKPPLGQVTDGRCGDA